MHNINAWTEDIIYLTTEADADDATTATLLVGNVGEEAIYTRTVSFENGIADLTIPASENIEANIPFGEYKYMVKVEYTAGEPITFPEPKSLPSFTISPRIK